MNLDVDFFHFKPNIVSIRKCHFDEAVNKAESRRVSVLKFRYLKKRELFSIRVLMNYYLYNNITF